MLQQHIAREVCGLRIMSEGHKDLWNPHIILSFCVNGRRNFSHECKISVV